MFIPLLYRGGRLRILCANCAICVSH